MGARQAIPHGPGHHGSCTDSLINKQCLATSSPGGRPWQGIVLALKGSLQCTVSAAASGLLPEASALLGKATAAPTSVPFDLMTTHLMLSMTAWLISGHAMLLPVDALAGSMGGRAQGSRACCTSSDSRSMEALHSVGRNAIQLDCNPLLLVLHTASDPMISSSPASPASLPGIQPCSENCYCLHDDFKMCRQQNSCQGSESDIERRFECAGQLCVGFRSPVSSRQLPPPPQLLPESHPPPGRQGSTAKRHCPPCAGQWSDPPSRLAVAVQGCCTLSTCCHCHWQRLTVFLGNQMQQKFAEDCELLQPWPLEFCPSINYHMHSMPVCKLDFTCD